MAGSRLVEADQSMEVVELDFSQHRKSQPNALPSVQPAARVVKVASGLSTRRGSGLVVDTKPR